MLPFKADFFEILAHAIPEIPSLRQSLIDGKINGTCYEGECACLVGTIAIIRKCDYGLLEGIKPDGSRPAEKWFYGIKTGDKPEDNYYSRMALEWLDEFQGLITPKPKKAIVKKVPAKKKPATKKAPAKKVPAAKKTTTTRKPAAKKTGAKKK